VDKMSVKPGGAWWILGMGAISTHGEEPKYPDAGPVTSLTLTPSGTSVVLSWVAPTPMPGSPSVVSYIVDLNGETIETTDTGYVWTGLNISTTYTFTVYAKSDLGTLSTGVQGTTTTLAATDPSQQPVVQAIASNTVKIVNADAGLVYYSTTGTDVSALSQINNVNSINVPMGSSTIWAAYAGITDVSLMQGTPISVASIQHNCPTGGTHDCNCTPCGTHSCNCTSGWQSCGPLCGGTCAGGGSGGSGCGCYGNSSQSWGQCGCHSAPMCWYNWGETCGSCTSYCCQQCPNLGECSPPAGYVKAYNQWWKIDNPATRIIAAFVAEEQSISETFAPTTVSLPIDRTTFIDIGTSVKNVEDPVFMYKEEFVTVDSVTDPITSQEVFAADVGLDDGILVKYPRFYLVDSTTDDIVKKFEFDDVILTVFDEDGDLIEVTNLSSLEEDTSIAIIQDQNRYRLALTKFENADSFTVDFIVDDEVAKTITSKYDTRDLEISWA